MRAFLSNHRSTWKCFSVFYTAGKYQKSFANRYSKLSHFFCRHENFLASLVIILALCVFYNDVIFREKTFLMQNITSGTFQDGPYNAEQRLFQNGVADAGAIAFYQEPFNWFYSRSIKSGDFPFWNPSSGLAGYPIFSDGVMGPLEPVHFIFFLFPDSLWVYTNDIQLLVRFFLAGFFTYLFARRLKIGFLGGIVAGLSYMFCTYLVLYNNHPQVKPDTLFPLIVYCFDRLADRGDRKAPFLTAFAICWILFAAMPESTLFALGFGSLWFFYQSISENIGETFTFRQYLFFIRRYLFATVFGFALSAVYLLPFIELVSLGASFHHPGTSSNFFIPIGALTSVVVFFAPALNTQYHMGFLQIALGILVVLTVHRVPAFRKEIAFFAGYAILCFLIFLNFPLLAWISKLPILSQVIFSKYSLPSIAFCFAILAGIAIQKIPLGIFTKRNVALLIIIQYVLFILIPAVVNPAEFKELYLYNRYAPMLLFTLITSIVFYGLAVLASSQKIQMKHLQVILIFLVCIGANIPYIQFERPNRMNPYQPPPFIKYLQADPAPFRIFATGDLLYPNIASVFKIADIRYLYALIPETTYEFSTRLIAPDIGGIRLTGYETPASDRMFELLNVKYVVSPDRNPFPENYSLVFQEEGINIFQNQNQPQPIFLVNEVKGTTDSEEAMRYLLNDQIDFRRFAVVENLPLALERNINQYTENSFQLLDYRQVKSGRVEAAVRVTNPGLIIASIQNYPGWQAEINGQTSPIYTTNGIFIGVYLEEGLHRLVLQYDPRSVKIGALISIFAFFVLMIVLFIRVKKHASAL